MARYAGIEFALRHVRVAIVRTSYRRVVVESLLEAPLVEGTSPATTLQNLLGKIRVDGTAVALPGDRCFFRRLEVPVAAAKDLENVLAFELESSVPFEMEQAVYDNRILRAASRAQHGDDANIVVFAAIARTEDVRERLELVREAMGREPDSVDPGSITLANLVSVVPELGNATNVDGTPAPVALLELGVERSELVFIEGGEPAFARMISRGAQGLPESAPFLARELKQSFAAWRAVGGGPVKALYISGEGSSARGAAAYFSPILEIPVEQLPKMRVEIAPADEARLPSFAKPIALALSNEGKSRSLNLRRGPLEAARSFAFIRERLPLFSGLAAVVLVSFGFSVVAEMRSLTSERALLDQQLEATTKEVFGEPVFDVSVANERLKSGATGEDDPYPTVDAFDVMVQLSKAVPKTVVHDLAELDIARGHVVLQGLLPDGIDAQKTAEQIADGLKENPCFRDVKVLKVTQAAAEKQKYVLELDLRCEDKKKTPATSGSKEPQ